MGAGMFVGRARIELELPEGGTLKDKRRVVKGLLARMRRRFEVACAEVDRLDDHHRATLGMAMVSNDCQHVASVLTHIEAWLSATPEAVLLDFQSEIV